MRGSAIIVAPNPTTWQAKNEPVFVATPPPILPTVQVSVAAVAPPGRASKLTVQLTGPSEPDPDAPDPDPDDNKPPFPGVTGGAPIKPPATAVVSCMDSQ
jgi:hypothetical protein